MGPVGRNENRAAVVARLLEMMREAKRRGCDLVVFTECALTPFFPRWWEEDLSARDQWFEREMPGPETRALFDEAKTLGIGFHLGYAELAESNGETRHYNAGILVGPDGGLIGKYRKIHLAGLVTKEGENPHRSYERRYFDTGNLGFRAWRAFGGVIGTCLGNDRRWPETYRVLALQGAEIILVGYNTVADHPDHPELDHLTNFHSLLSMQAGAYQNGCFVIGVAKAGLQEGIHQIGRSAIIAPSGEVVTQCTSLADELVVHRCDLERTKLYREHVFPFAVREIEAYALITKTKVAVPPREAGDIGEENLTSAATEADGSDGKLTADPIEKLFTQKYGYSPEEARKLADRAKLAGAQYEPTAEEKPSPKTPPPKKPVRELSADPVQAIREVLQESYNYSAAQLEAIIPQVVRALELAKPPQDSDSEAATPSKPQTNASAAEILTREELAPNVPPTEDQLPPTAEYVPKNPPASADSPLTEFIDRSAEAQNDPRALERGIVASVCTLYGKVRLFKEDFAGNRGTCRSSIPAQAKPIGRTTG